MRLRLSSPLLALLLAMAGPRARGEEPDDLQLRLLEPYPLSVRWDNIEGPPRWVSGPEPDRVFREGMHVISLAPGATVVLRLPARAWLRAFAPGGSLQEGDLEFWISDGSGVYVEGVPRRSPAGRSLVVAPPDRPGPLLVRVTRPARQGGAVNVALFVSRPEFLKPIAPYRGIVDLPLPHERVRREDEELTAECVRIAPGAPLSLKVSGPVRLAVEVRLHYSPDETSAIQAFRVFVRLDGAVHQTLEFETTADSTLPVYVDDRPQAMSRREVAALEIPKGDHALELDPTAALAVRLLRLEDPDYLLPGLNGPRPGVGALREAEIPTTVTAPPWGLTEEESRRIAAAGPRAAAEKRRLAFRLARDNGRRDGGLLGAMLLAGAAAEHPEYPPLRDLADEALVFHTYYRDLLPVELRPDLPRGYAWFRHSRLLDVYETPYDMVIAEPHVDGLVANIPSGCFLALPAGPEAALRCRVPDRFGPSQLRVTVENGSLRGMEEIRVQFDQQPPVRILAVPGPELPAEALRPSPEEAALAVQDWRDRGRPLAGGESGAAGSGIPPAPELRRTNRAATARAALPRDGGTAPFLLAGRGLPDQRVHAGIVEIPLPPEVREVRVWSAAPAPGPDGSASPPAPLRAALQYRASKSHRLGESEYLEIIRRAGDTYGLADAILQKEAPAGTDPLAVQELNNQWLPLVRRMRAQRNVFMASVAPPRPPAPGAAPTTDDSEGKALVEQARKWEQAGDWQAALEIWGRLVYTARGDVRQQALFGRVAALQELGQEFLADKLLRGLMIHDPDETVRREALVRLAKRRVQEGDAEALSILFAAAAVRTPTPTLLRSYAEARRASDDPEAALAVGLGIPSAERPVLTLLAAAHQMGWWRTFEDLTGQLPTEVERAYWQGLRLCAQGDLPRALERLRQGGESGQAMAASLEQGLAIRADLAAADPTARLRAVLAWERWQGDAPGSRRWIEDDSLVVDGAGTEIVQRVDGDGFPRVYYRTGPGRPVRLHVPGPLRLRIEVRLLLPQGTTTPVDDWLSLREPGRLREIPLMGIAPSPELIVLGDATHVPGERVLAEQEFGPGLHELEVSSDLLPLLVRAYAHRPEIPLGVLPPISRGALEAVCRRAPEAGPPPVEYPAGALVLSADGRSAVSVPVRRIADGADAGGAAPGRDPAGQSPPAPAGAVADGLPAVVQSLAARAGGASAGETLQFLAHWGFAPASRPVPAPDTPGLPPAEREAALLAQGNIEAALALPLAEGDDAVLRRMGLLLRLAERKPELRPRALALSEALFAAHPRVAGLSTMHAKLVRDSLWNPVTSIQSSAGLRGIDVKGWSPESPGLRLRKALLAPLAPEDQVLYGTDRFGVSFMNLRPTEVTLDLTLEDVDYLMPVPLTAVYQVDQGTEEKVTLTPESPVRSLRANLAEGQHSVRVRLEQPLPLQALRVGMREKRPGPDAPANVAGEALVKTVSRSYHVATSPEPVRVKLEGPAWLRIDELRGDRTDSRYRLLNDGWQEIELKPEEGQAEALLRLFVRAPGPGPATPPPPLRPMNVPSDPLPPPLIPSSRVGLADPLTLADPYPLGGQEDGTWEFSARREKRRLLEDDRRKAGDPDWFEQVSAAYRYYDDDGTWTQTEMLLRAHDDSGPTLGLRGRYLHRPRETLINLRAEAGLYAQEPYDPLPGKNGQWEFSGTARGTVERVFELNPTMHHTPSLSIFGRAMSMVKTRYEPGRVDHDVFTRYKELHRFGIEVAESFKAQPWLDTEWSARVSLTSNENMVAEAPDNLGWGLGWSQFLGPVQADLHYQAYLFFNDGDRASTFARHSLIADAVWWDLPVANRHRLEVGVSVRQDFNPLDTSGVLFVTWYFDNGRGYRDFMPGSVDFPDLRRRRLLRGIDPFVPGMEQ